MQRPSQSLGARIGDAVVSAVSADQRLARSTHNPIRRGQRALEVEHARTDLI